MHAREWGPWSVWKTELILTPYVREFLMAGTRSLHRTFIDCYAGASFNRERATGRTLQSSIQMALDACSINGAAFTHLAACELPERAHLIEERCSVSRQGQSFRVFPGDVNCTIRDVLRWWESEGGERSGPRFGQTFAYVDPDKHSDLSWDLLELIGSPRAERRRRVEQLILLPLGTMRRALPVRPGTEEASDQAMRAVDRMFGDDTWRRLYARQRNGHLAGDDAWRKYSDLFRWRLRCLGYQHVCAVEAVNTNRTLQYHLVLASDEPVGQKIFNAVCENASEELPRLIAAERDLARQRDETPLFDVDAVPIRATGPPARLFDGEPDINEILGC